MPALDNAIARYAAMVAEVEFTGEAEAVVEGALANQPVRPSAQVS